MSRLFSDRGKPAAGETVAGYNVRAAGNAYEFGRVGWEIGRAVTDRNRWRLAIPWAQWFESAAVGADVTRRPVLHLLGVIMPERIQLRRRATLQERAEIVKRTADVVRTAAQGFAGSLGVADDVGMLCQALCEVIGLETERYISQRKPHSPAQRREIADSIRRNLVLSWVRECSKHGVGVWVDGADAGPPAEKA